MSALLSPQPKSQHKHKRKDYLDLDLNLNLDLKRLPRPNNLPGDEAVSSLAEW
jgi:hypothetical protein